MATLRREVFGDAIHAQTLYGYVRRGLLPHVRVGARILFDLEAVAAWAAAGGTALADAVPTTPAAWRERERPTRRRGGAA